MASFVWNSQGGITVDYLEEGRTINSVYFEKRIKAAASRDCEERRGKLTQGVLLLQDNAPVHTSQVAMAATTNCGFVALPHPPYSLDLAPLDFYLFPNLKTNLPGRNFGSNEGIIDAVEEYLRDQEEYFSFEGISKLEQHWRRCIKAKGDYIEK